MLAGLALRLQALRKLPALSCILLFVAMAIELSILVAGLKPGLVEYANMLTINTSKIGPSTNPSSKHSRSLNDVLSPTTPITVRDNTLKKAKEAAAKSAKDKASTSKPAAAATSASGDAAEKLGLKDWYSYHLSSACSGTYTKPDPKSSAAKGTVVAAATTTLGKKQTKECTKPKAFFAFDPAGEMQKTLTEGKKLADVGWGEELSKLTRGSTAVAMRGVMLCYVVGIIGMGGSFALAGLAAFNHGGYTIMKMRVWCAVGTAGTLFLASAVQSLSISKLADIINAGGSIINVHAYVGKVFTVLSWTTTTLAVLLYLMVLWERRRMFRMIA